MLLNEGRFLDTVLIFYIAKKFITPFKRWRAFELGLIDEKGKRTKKKIKTSEEKNAYTLLDRLIRKVRVFVGDHWFLKLTLAYLLLKEDFGFEENKKLINENINQLEGQVQIGSLESIYFYYNKDESVFGIHSSLKNPEIEGTGIITSQFGGKFPFNIKKLFSILNSGFSNLLQGGYREEYFQEESFILKFSYSANEIKIESVLDEGITIDNQFGKFYVMFNNKEEAKNFMNKWEEFYDRIIYGG